MNKSKNKVSSHFTSVDDKLIHHLEAGSGDPLVFLHAFGTSSKTFEGLISYLSRNFKVYAPDLPGFGLSDELGGRLSYQKMIKHIRKWMRYLNLSNFTLSGASLGGVLSVYFTKEYDDLAKNYVLIEPYLGIDTLIFPKSTILFLKGSAFFFNKILSGDLGKSFWEKKKLLLNIEKTFNPLQNEIDKNRPDEQKLSTFSCATFSTFWNTVELIVKQDISSFQNLSKKKTAFIMPNEDESLDFKETYRGYKRMFPNMKTFRIDLTGHYPVEPLTTEFIERKFPDLLDNISKYLAD